MELKTAIAWWELSCWTRRSGHALLVTTEIFVNFGQISLLFGRYYPKNAMNFQNARLRRRALPCSTISLSP